MSNLSVYSEVRSVSIDGLRCGTSRESIWGNLLPKVVNKNSEVEICWWDVVRAPYLRERDTISNLEFDEKGETNEEELLQAESEHDGTAEQEKQTPVTANNKLKKNSRDTKTRWVSIWDGIPSTNEIFGWKW